MITVRVIRSGGDARAHLRGLLARVRGGGRVEAGFPDSVPADVRQRAIYNEFGTRTTPERPFMRVTIASDQHRWMNDMRRDMRALVNNRITKRAMLNGIGERVVGDIQDTILHGSFAPNAPSTIAGKGSDQPLIDTGTMLSSVTHQITEA